jgi:multiple sugar transport system permease protein/raffinose/stachyose/melibiose transport system permease protein
MSDKQAVLPFSSSQAATVVRRPWLTTQRQKWLFLLPAVVLVALFYILPNVLNFALSLTDWSSYKTAINFIGFRNFSDLMATNELLNALWVTIRFALLVVIIENTFALGLALALEESTPLNIFLRSVFFVPVLISTLAAGYIFVSLLQPSGVFNSALSALTALVGLPPVTNGWLGDLNTALVAVAFVHAWKFGGIHMFVYLSGLKAIPHDLIEAAKLDGASALQVFRFVRVPLLSPAFTFNITLTFIGALSIFEVILSMTRGGPGRATEVMNLAVWRQFGTGAFAYATSISAVLLVVILIVAIPLIAFLRRREVEL